MTQATAESTERRAQPRHKMSAQVKVRETATGQYINARLVDLSLGGCFVETENPLPTGTATDIVISKAAQTFHFHAQAKVVSNVPNKGMGLEFTSMGAGEFRILVAWLDQSLRFYQWGGKFASSWAEEASSLFYANAYTGGPLLTVGARTIAVLSSSKI